jgi:hypothetical protein
VQERQEFLTAWQARGLPTSAVLSAYQLLHDMRTHQDTLAFVNFCLAFLPSYLEGHA